MVGHPMSDEVPLDHTIRVACTRLRYNNYDMTFRAEFGDQQAAAAAGKADSAAGKCGTSLTLLKASEATHTNVECF
jgi:hypothetical protein